MPLATLPEAFSLDAHDVESLLVILVSDIAKMNLVNLVLILIVLKCIDDTKIINIKFGHSNPLFFA